MRVVECYIYRVRAIIWFVSIVVSGFGCFLCSLESANKNKNGGNGELVLNGSGREFYITSDFHSIMNIVIIRN